jgi:hypothetical protein
MALKKPLVIGSNGYLEELQASDSLSDIGKDTISGTSGEAIAANDAVYVDSATGKLKKAKADAGGTLPAVGFAIEEATAADQAITYQTDGPLGGFTSLTPGSPYYVSGATAGAITSTPPSGSGKYMQPVAIAISQTEIEITISYPIKRG